MRPLNRLTEACVEALILQLVSGGNHDRILRFYSPRDSAALARILAMPVVCAGSKCTARVNKRYVTFEDEVLVRWCVGCYAVDKHKRGIKLGISKNPDELCVQCGEKWRWEGIRLANDTALRMCSGCASKAGGSSVGQQCTGPRCTKTIRWNAKDSDGRTLRLCVSCARNDGFDVPQSSQAQCEVCSTRNATYGAQPVVDITK